MFCLKRGKSGHFLVEVSHLKRGILVCVERGRKISIMQSNHIIVHYFSDDNHPLAQVVFVSTMYGYSSPTYYGYEYGWAGLAFGKFIACAPLIPLPMYAAYLLLVTPGSFMEVSYPLRNLKEGKSHLRLESL